MLDIDALVEDAVKCECGSLDCPLNVGIQAARNSLERIAKAAKAYVEARQAQFEGFYKPDLTVTVAEDIWAGPWKDLVQALEGK